MKTFGFVLRFRPEVLSRFVAAFDARGLRAVVMMFALAALAGCGSQTPLPKLDRATWLNETTRTYEGISEKALFAAAKKVLLHADPKWKIDESPAKMTAKRTCFQQGAASKLAALAIAGSYKQEECDVTLYVEKSGGALKVHAEFGEDNQYKGLLALTNSGRKVEGKKYWIHELFFARLDYMLGRKQTWLTCKQEKALLRKEYGAQDFGLDALCEDSNDSVPPAPSS